MHVSIHQCLVVHNFDVVVRHIHLGTDCSLEYQLLQATTTSLKIVLSVDS